MKNILFVLCVVVCATNNVFAQSGIKIGMFGGALPRVPFTSQVYNPGIVGIAGGYEWSTPRRSGIGVAGTAAIEWFGMATRPNYDDHPGGWGLGANITVGPTLGAMRLYWIGGYRFRSWRVSRTYVDPYCGCRYSVFTQQPVNQNPLNLYVGLGGELRLENGISFAVETYTTVADLENLDSARPRELRVLVVYVFGR